MGKDIKPLLSFTDPAFDIKHLSRHTLAIDLSADHLACAVHDHDRNKFVAIESYSTGKPQSMVQFADQLREIIESAQILNASYQKVRIVWEGKQFTMIPVELFNEKQTETYIQFTQSLPASSAVFADTMKNMHAVNAYGIPSIIKETLSSAYPNHKLNHYLTILVESLLIANKNGGQNNKTYVNISAQSFDLIVIRDGKLLFCNTFDYRSAEDVIYFILFSFEQLGISAADAGAVLIGDILKPSAIHDLMYKYIRDITFIPRSKAWEYSYVFNDVPGHFHYTLLNILTCE
jgi:hypothetical protein